MTGICLKSIARSKISGSIVRLSAHDEVCKIEPAMKTLIKTATSLGNKACILKTMASLEYRALGAIPLVTHHTSPEKGVKYRIKTAILW